MSPSLLDELGRDWPPVETPAEAAYVTIPFAGLRLLDACELPGGDVGRRLVVAIAADVADRLVLVPLVWTDRRWRRALPGDGLSTALVDALAGKSKLGGGFGLLPLADPPQPREPAERAIGVDQTNASVVVGDAIIVKWLQLPEPGEQRAATLLAHLAAVGFDAVPRPFGSLSWTAPDGQESTIALADAYLPDARDGWDWCVARLEAHLEHEDGPCPPDCDAWIGGPLGRLVAGLHVALALPSDVIPEPIAYASPELVDRWRAAALATFDEAIKAQDQERGGELGALASPIRNVLATLATDSGTPVQPIHGDLHVGQVLEGREGFAIIDFDGNPTLGAKVNAALQPGARDVAQMTTSLDHVGRVVAERVEGALVARVGTWIAETTAEFIAAYTAGLESVGRRDLFDEALVAPFEVEQECRELVYAARFLPRWRYAPMAALRARFRGR
jgi:maltokinase